MVSVENSGVILARVWRWRIVWVLILLAGSVAAVRYWKERDLEKPPPADIDRRQNAIWMAHRWFGQAPPAEEIKTAGEHLAGLGFRDLYFHAGPLDANADIPKWDAAAWKKTLARFRAAIPGLRAYAWVGGITVQSYGKAPDTVDMTLPEVRQAIVRTCVTLLNQGGFDGIHYDIENIAPRDPAFVQLLEDTRPAIRPHLLSVATPYWWNPEYLKRVAEHCDQVAIMTYEVGKDNPTEYESYLEDLMPVVCDRLEETRCRLIVGVPTYGEPGAHHDPATENMTTAILGIKAGLFKAPRHHAFQGLGVYAHWTTDDASWKAMERYWRP